MIWFALYAATIVAANWLIAAFGLVPVGFGLLAPAGVYAAGLAFTFRDLLHESKGAAWALLAVFVGAALSLAVSPPQFALASCLAFAASEVLDCAVYAPLRRRGWLRAVAASNLVGFVADSALFLWLAFGSLDFLAGQVVGKAWVTLVAVLLLWGWRALWRRVWVG
ncbi:MAG TPA: VUT family protein [Acidimicrobiales bacterium]|nr:VUT family protein [Acidimicrobiales bacterium]